MTNDPRPAAPRETAAERPPAGTTPEGSTTPGLVALALLTLAAVGWHPAAGAAGVALSAIVLFGFAASLAPSARPPALREPAAAGATSAPHPGRDDGESSRGGEGRRRDTTPTATPPSPSRVPAELLLAAAFRGSVLGSGAGVFVLAAAALRSTTGHEVVDALGFAGVLLAGAALAARDAARALSRAATTALPAIEARECLGLRRRGAAMTSFGQPCFRVAARIAAVLAAAVLAGDLLGGAVAAAALICAAAVAAAVSAFTTALRLAEGLSSAPRPVPLVVEIRPPEQAAARPAVFDSRPDREQEGGFADID